MARAQLPQQSAASNRTTDEPRFASLAKVGGELGVTRGAILVIDDEVDILEMIEAGLSVEGYELELADGGARGLAMFDARRPDLVICDIKMPGLGGVATITKLRERDPDLPVIVLTGYLSPDTIQQCRDLGGVELVRKPFTFGELLRVVASTLRRLRG